MKKLEMQNVILTFDYELFLGEDSGTAKKSIIEPVNKILDIFEQYNAKGIFFVDAMYLLKLKEYEHKDFNILAKQIQKIIKQGSSVELHLHPHWIDACLSGKDRWKFKSYKHYRLHSFDEDRIITMFIDGKNILEDIIREVKKDYKITAFRAGGWSISPFQKLKKAFEKSGIKYDFSVVPGLYRNEKPCHYYDFRNVSFQKSYWKFSDDANLEDKLGTFVEFPLSVAKLNKLTSIINKYLIRRKPLYGNGKGMGVFVKGSLGNRLRIFLKNNKRTLTCDSTSLFLFKLICTVLKNKEMLVFVSHPKMLTVTGEKIIKHLSSNYNTVDLSQVDQILHFE